MDSAFELVKADMERALSDLQRPTGEPLPEPFRSMARIDPEGAFLGAVLSGAIPNTSWSGLNYVSYDTKDKKADR